MIRFIKGRSWDIVNGETEGDWERVWTYTRGRGNSIIDYVLGDEEIRGDIIQFGLGESMKSDHHPLIMTIGGEREEVRERNRRKGARRRGERCGIKKKGSDYKKSRWRRGRREYRRICRKEI